MGRHRLHPRSGDRHADHQAARVAIRPQALLSGERAPIHGRVDDLRTRSRSRQHGRVPRAPGVRRRRPPHRLTGDPARKFPARRAGSRYGPYELGAVLAPAFGPTLGGWITDQYSWPWIFYINVPIGIINTILVSRFIHDPPYLVRTKRYVDWPGLALLVVGLGALQ